jgi:hypothetical protein
LTTLERYNQAQSRNAELSSSWILTGIGSFGVDSAEDAGNG